MQSAGKRQISQFKIKVCVGSDGKVTFGSGYREPGPLVTKGRFGCPPL